MAGLTELKKSKKSTLNYVWVLCSYGPQILSNKSRHGFTPSTQLFWYFDEEEWIFQASLDLTATPTVKKTQALQLLTNTTMIYFLETFTSRAEGVAEKRNKSGRLRELLKPKPEFQSAITMMGRRSEQIERQTNNLCGGFPFTWLLACVPHSHSRRAIPTPADRIAISIQAAKSDCQPVSLIHFCSLERASPVFPFCKAMQVNGLSW